jgi:sugar lactone lactonase YvrE
MTPWFIYSTRPDGLSVNAQLNVVVTRPSLGDIRVYTPGGELIRNITLQSDVTEPHQAIQLDDDRFVVVHGDHDDVHRVCIVNSEGRIIQSYGGHKGSDIRQLNRPFIEC